MTDCGTTTITNPSRGWRAAGLALALLVPLALAACGEKPAAKGPGGMPPAAVVVERAALRDFTRENVYTGRIEAIDKVGVRARIQGFLQKQNFADGAEVKKGQALFEIEREPFEVTVRQAEANLAAANAAEDLAEKVFERTDNLSKRGTATQASLDDARSNLLQARATVKSREADLQKANLDLGYTRIIAPLEGRTGRAAYSVGELVGPTSDPLVTLVAQDPMYVTFPVPQKRLLEVRNAYNTPESVYVELKLANGSVYPQRGAIRFADIAATSGTDSVIVRAAIANPDRLLVDQQLVQVAVISRQAEPQLAISQAALMLDQQGPYVFVIGADNKAEIRRIATGPQNGALIAVASGLRDGERVVVSGHQKVQPGMVVNPAEAAAGMGGMSGMSGGMGN
jgi:membrane fusion protein (multidrug efflux system)